MKSTLKTQLDSSWRVIPPYWPLNNLIAVNPLVGFEDYYFEQALSSAQNLFQVPTLDFGMHNVNRESLKWLQAYFDEGQSTFEFPGRGDGFLKSVLALMSLDSTLSNRSLLNDLPSNPLDIIDLCLKILCCDPTDRQLVLTLSLTTLPGWASHILYRSEWAPEGQKLKATKEEFTAFRLILMAIFNIKVRDLIDWHQQAKNQNSSYERIQNNEKSYQTPLFEKLNSIKGLLPDSSVQAQFVFCIDVRSEPFRRNIETVGPYETFGFAGFFGVPISVCQSDSGERFNSCPVLVKPQHQVTDHSKKAKLSRELRELYQSTKYAFTTSFPLVETLGFWSGMMMGINSFFPKLGNWINKQSEPKLDSHFQFSIPLNKQRTYAISVLRTMGLVQNFAPLVFLCGHRGESQNNAFATALDCGACGGRPGGINSYVLAKILNNPDVRVYLQEHDIIIPTETYFVAAEHNTTTDELVIIDGDISDEYKSAIDEIQITLKKAQRATTDSRLINLGERSPTPKSANTRSQDWSQPRPEWALARNAGFIIAPRSLTKSLDLEGRSFLHSYDWQLDDDASILTSIMTAPLIVGYWINTQYLFSTLDPIAYGAGSKVTKNITGKLGITQGNLSDLMHGLPLQSIGLEYDTPYHEPLRLTVVIYAPKERIISVIAGNEQLTTLVQNQWFHVFSMDPKTHNIEKVNLYTQLS